MSETNVETRRDAEEGQKSEDEDTESECRECAVTGWRKMPSKKS